MDLLAAALLRRSGECGVFVCRMSTRGAVFMTWRKVKQWRGFKSPEPPRLTRSRHSHRSRRSGGAFWKLFPIGRSLLMDLIVKRIRIIGSQQNGPEYLYEALDFVAQGKVKAIVETYPLFEAAKAYQRVAEGKTRFRAVLTM